ncbi:MAG: hypothetical protein PF569_09555 [Candidatus Woesearchaeota archaeon]|jgi:hypothetical protein|nr:hypothetical protein [Candidatus Woesearchaeota archaeon]
MWIKSDDLDNNCCQCLWRQDGGDSSNQHSPLTSSDYVTLYGVDGGSLNTI